MEGYDAPICPHCCGRPAARGRHRRRACFSECGKRVRDGNVQPRSLPISKGRGLIGTFPAGRRPWCPWHATALLIDLQGIVQSCEAHHWKPLLAREDRRGGIKREPVQGTTIGEMRGCATLGHHKRNTGMPHPLQLVRDSDCKSESSDTTRKTHATEWTHVQQSLPADGVVSENAVNTLLPYQQTCGRVRPPSTDLGK